MKETTLGRRFMAGELVLVGVNHNTAPVEIRERLAIPAGALADATRSLLSAPGIREGLIVSTCNRVELLTVQESAETSDAHSPRLLRFLDEYFAIPAATIRPHLYEYREGDAVRHLFRVASSLDSMVVGEPQILGQVKEAYTVAREVGAIGPNADGDGSALDRLLQSAFTVAKKVRNETQIGSSSVSIASVAVDLARKIFGSLAGKHVLLVGAGKMSELALRHLIQHGVTNLYIANRTAARAESVAQSLRGQATAHPLTTEVIAFEELYAQAQRADIVITSTGASQPLFQRTHGQQFIQRRRGRPMFFIDIAVPRDVDPRMNQVDGCFVYDIDDLQQVAAANLADRGREAAAAEKIVSDEVARYQQRLQALDAVPVIRAVQESMEAMRQAELARSAKLLAGLSTEQRMAVEALTRGLTTKFLHTPMTAIRSAAEQGNTQELERLLELFSRRPER
jgi:glutamyl-tRNA reductase